MWLKRAIKYLPEVLLFGGILSLLLIDVTPKLSWMMVNSDVGANILASKYFYPEHGTGEPLSVLLGRLFLYIPFGSDSWRMALMSVLSTVGAMVFVYLTVRELLKGNKRNRIIAIISALVFGSSMLVISQAIIVQLYALITMLSLGAFYFTVKKNWVMTSVMIGLGLATHHLILIIWLILIIAHKELRQWKPILITLSFLAFYLYSPIIKYFGVPDNWVNTTVFDFFRTNLATANALIGTISVWDFPARLFSTLGIVGISLGLGLIPLVYYLWKKRQWKSELLFLFALPIIYYVTDLAPDTAKYFEPSIGFGAILAGLGLSKLNIKMLYATAIVAVVLLSININAFDIGRTLDPELSAQKFYDEELPKIPDGEIFMTTTAWEWQLTLLYNKNESRHIIPVCIGTLTGEPYLDQLERQGVKMTRYDMTNMNDNERQGVMAKTILESNKNVWMDIVTNSATYGGKVTKGDNGQISGLLARVKNTPTPAWNIKPSNPYDVVTGSIQIKEWQYLNYSNWNMRLVIGLASAGLILNWFMFVLPKKRAEETI